MVKSVPFGCGNSNVHSTMGLVFVVCGAHYNVFILVVNDRVISDSAFNSMIESF